MASHQVLKEVLATLLDEPVLATGGIAVLKAELYAEVGSEEVLAPVRSLASALYKSMSSREPGGERSAPRVVRIEECPSTESLLAWGALSERVVRSLASRALLLVLRDRDGLLGVVGLLRGMNEPRFSETEREQLEAISPHLVGTISAQIACEALERELAATRAVGEFSGTILIVDREKHRLYQVRSGAAGNDGSPISNDWVVPIEESACRLLDECGGSGRCRIPSIGATLTRVTPLRGEAFPPGQIEHRWLALQLEIEANHAADALSRRESEVAHMLASGYTAVNIAATYGLSENTVRTYMRRLYRKLAVNNRADLVRQMLEPARPARPSVAVSPAFQVNPTRVA